MSEPAPPIHVLREVLRLACRFNLSANKIHVATGVAIATVQRCVGQARQANLTWTALLMLDDSRLSELLFVDDAFCKN